MLALLSLFVNTHLLPFGVSFHNDTSAFLVSLYYVLFYSLINQGISWFGFISDEEILVLIVYLNIAS